MTTPGPVIGSLFTGYGGLELGVRAAIGGTVAWHSEVDPGACKVLAHHWPDVPNLGDITAVDWTQVEPVDVLTGGFPCQDVSHAGKRGGLRPDTRTGLWSQMAYAIDQLRPRLVVAENVRGLLSAAAHSDLEPCPWCVGDGPRQPALRALGAVLGDLADLRYDASWCGLRAADVGACHGRFRVFVVAWPAADTGGIRREGVDGADDPATEAGRWPAQDSRRWAPTRRGDAAATDTDRSDLRDATRKRPDQGDGLQPRGDGREGDAHKGGRGDATADADRTGRGGVAQLDAPSCTRVDRQHRRHPDGRCDGTDWGAYTGAITRWGHVLGRPAPAPTEPGRTGAPRLSPAFVEWLMGLPAGHVTAVPGLSRNAQLKALGNGVVPAQAEAALRWLLGGGRPRVKPWVYPQEHGDNW